MNQLMIKKKNELTTNKKKGFTLVELIIVIAIIAILAAMAIPKFSAVRIDAKVSNDLAAAKNIQSATATMVANGTIKGAKTKLAVPSDSSDTEEIGNEIAKRVASNNGSSTIAPEAIPTGTFNVAVTEGGDVTVFVTVGTVDYQLVPETQGDNNKAAYAKAASTPAAPKPAS